MKRLPTIIFCLSLMVQNALAQSQVDQGANIGVLIAEVTLGNGPVTKREYDKFWTGIGANNPEDKQRIIMLLRVNFMAMQDYQREVWKCAEKAWNSRVVPKCEQSKVKLAQMKAAIQKSSPVSVLEVMEKNSTNLLEAAAKRGVFKSVNVAEGEQLSLELIQETKRNIDSMLSRFQQVLRINY